jgi:hypothetical protein
VLLGGNEIDLAGKARAGDLDGYGTASVIYVGRDGLCFTLAVHNIDRPRFAHIHRGPAGVNGGVVINLAPPSAPGAGSPGVAAGCLKSLSPALLNAIRLTPSEFYVNVHTVKFPDGALRGQLF